MVANDHATHLHFCLCKYSLHNRWGLSQSLTGKQKQNAIVFLPEII
jgi:hypothetical protein